MTTFTDDQIRTRTCPDCRVCGTKGEPLHQRLRDRLFGAPGEWDLKKCPNPQCGLVWLDPMPLEEDIGKAYRTYHTHQDYELPDTPLRRAYRRVKAGYTAGRYGYRINGIATFDRILGRMIYLHPGRRAQADAEVFYLDAQPGGRLLEVGCGGGVALKRMQALGWQVEGVDFDPKGVRNAQAKGLTVHLGDLARQGYPDNSFDAVAMSHVIEHVPDPLALLRECRRILKPGGRLVVLTPNVASWGHGLYGSDWRGLEPPRHLHLFNPASLTAAAAHAGFGAIDCRSSARARGMFLASRAIRRTGKADSAGRYPLALRVWAEGMELLEWVFLLANRNLGEEIVLIGEA